jgi:ubiquitin-like protein Pup
MERKQAVRRHKEADSQEEGEQASPSRKGEKLKADLDELLDEIDDVLYENAEQMAREYVQKGGQ